MHNGGLNNMIHYKNKNNDVEVFKMAYFKMITGIDTGYMED